MKTLLLASLALVSLAAHATLGDDVAHLPYSRSAAGSAINVTTHALYSRHEYQTRAGTRVREFADAQGHIFALTWEGQAPLPLNSALGSYAHELVQAAPRHHPDHHRFDLQTGDLVLHSRVYLRQFRGAAYLPGQWPQALPMNILSQP